MTAERLLMVFPYIPLAAMTAAAAAACLFRRDVSRPALRCALGVQLLAGALLLWHTRGGATLDVPVSIWRQSIRLRFDPWKAYFLGAYLTPVLLAFLRKDTWSSPSLRIVFMFYLGGCGSLIVTGDVFNFFVAYELMIMSAYVLVAARRRYFAAVRYMFFGAASSAPFLAGIILLYASGAPLAFPASADFAVGPDSNPAWLLLLFSVAFMIKAAFFPVSGWVAGCHSATVPTMSAFLGSFTIFSGIYGLLYLVVEPALAAGFAPALLFLRGVALVTLLAGAVFLFFEPDLKRCIAGSTVYSMGGIGLLLSHGLIEPALIYMLVHAAYKSAMFLIMERLDNGEYLRVRGSRLHLLAAAGATGAVAGLFPGTLHAVKTGLGDLSRVYELAGLAALTLFCGGFLKFRYSPSAMRKITDWGWPAFVAAAGIVFAFVFEPPAAPAPGKAALEWGLAAAAALTAARIYRRARAFEKLDRHIFLNLNIELFLVLLLAAAGAAVMVWR